jgi:cardiolipin hydrolase
MRTNPTAFLALVTWMASAAASSVAAEVAVYFSPHGGVVPAMVREIDAASTTIDMMSYSIADKRISAALLRAHARGVQVRLIVNPSQEAPEQSVAPHLHAAGLTIRTDRKHKLMHNKFIICDELVTCTGSANHSRSADIANAENLVVITDKEVATRFSINFRLHWSHSDYFKPIHRKVEEPKIPGRFQPLQPRRPRRKGNVSWHWSQDHSTQTMQAAGLLAA